MRPAPPFPRTPATRQTAVIVAVLLTFAAFAIWSLATGADYLGQVLPGGLPLGNALAATFLCALAAAAVGMSVRGTVLRRVSLAALMAAAAWLPVSILLAGNLALNFAGGRGDAWLMLSLAVAMAVLATLAWASIATIVAACRRRATLRRGPGL
ncbi:MAG TPA: hypothetical protein VIT90_13545 [Lysobacter sp.]